MVSKTTAELVEKDVAKLVAKIKHHVERSEKSLREIARESGTTHTTLMRLLEGEANPTAKTIFGVARCLGIPASAFWGDD